MESTRWDETWHRLREWTNDQGPSERLAAQILLNEGFTDLDPSHPLGGKDGGKDAVCSKDGKRWIMAVYFPRGQQDFFSIKKKFEGDLLGVSNNNAQGIAFVTNQELRLAERKELEDCVAIAVEIYHLERITTIIDTPSMRDVRSQFLNIAPSAPGARGGDGGGGVIVGDNGTIIGGRGGHGGVGLGRGGDGGSGFAQGNNALIVGGDGGSAGSPDGRGGRGACSPMERMQRETHLWKYGRGGSGANHPEYNRRIEILQKIRRDYMTDFPDQIPFIEAGVEPVPIG